MAQEQYPELRGVPPHKRRPAMQRLRWLREWWEVAQEQDGRGLTAKRRAFVQALRERDGAEISVATLYRFELAFRRGGLAGLVDGRGRTLSGSRYLQPAGKASPETVPLAELVRQLAALLRLTADRLGEEARR